MISGVVPAVATGAIELTPGALTFLPGQQVRDRVIGRVKFRFNIPLEAIQISSNTPRGIPTHPEFGPYPFGPGGFTVRLGACQGMEVTSSKITFSEMENTPVTLGRALELKSGVASVCDLLASWDTSDTPSEGASVANGNYTVQYSLALLPAV